MQFIDLKSRHQLLGDRIHARIQKVMEHGQFILGPEVREVEEKLAQYTGSKHCVTVSSGTDSLLIALMALDIGAGDEVITVPYTWISSAEVIALLGAKPVFVDISRDTLGMCSKSLKKWLDNNIKTENNNSYNKKTGAKVSAVIPMHTLSLIHISEPTRRRGIAVCGVGV